MADNLTVGQAAPQPSNPSTGTSPRSINTPAGTAVKGQQVLKGGLVLDSAKWRATSPDEGFSKRAAMWHKEHFRSGSAPPLDFKSRIKVTDYQTMTKQRQLARQMQETSEGYGPSEDTLRQFPTNSTFKRRAQTTSPHLPRATNSALSQATAGPLPVGARRTPGPDNWVVVPRSQLGSLQV